MWKQVGVGTLFALAGMAAMFCYTHSASKTSAVRINSRDLNRYPDTGYLPWGDPSAVVKRPSVDGLQRIAVFDDFTEHRNRIMRIEYADDIKPDEDLLLGLDPGLPLTKGVPLTSEAATVEASVSPPLESPRPPTLSPTSPTRSAPQPQQSTTVPVLEPRETPSRTTTADPAAEPELTTTPASTDASTDSISVDTAEFDPDRPPGPDEDLLQSPSVNARSSPPANDNSTQSSTGPSSPDPQRSPQVPVEVLPIVPQTDAPLPTDARSSPGPMGPGQLSWPSARNSVVAAPNPQTAATAIDPHAAVFAESLYPSAKKCRECHQQIYDEWAVSSHAYATISPMFQKFEQTISSLTRGTLGYFCMRCHAPVATALSYPRYASLIDGDLPDSALEGVTCIACHRVREQYGKANGERRIEPGDVHDPVYGSGTGEVLADIIRRKSEFKVKPAPSTDPGVDIHREVIHFDQISNSSFCVSCHQVFVAPGIELEVVWEQYRASPACKQGISCQDCHMGSQPGVAAGYDMAPVAVVNNKPISPDRKHSNHMFYGPGYSIAHPGVFPFNKEAEKWKTESWLKFDWRSGWGTDAFEDALEKGKFSAVFPKEWENADDRYDAREVVDANLKTLVKKKEMRRRLYENSSHVEGPILQDEARVGRPLKFHYVVSNISNGHNMPSGSLGAQPQLWLNVALTGPRGEHLWESGYVDSNGDICDVHSLEVAAGRAPRDQQLFNLQTKFLITHVKGTDREIYLPINTDIDQLPFIRPSGFPVTVMNHPPFIRMEAHSIPALGSRKAEYRVPARCIQQPGKYRLSVRLRSRAEPIYFMRFCNATPEMERSMNEWMVDVHEHATEFWVQ